MTRCRAPAPSEPKRAAGRRTGVRMGAALLATLSLGACDFPTAPPIFESRFIIPGESTTLSVNELLPSSITVSGNAFRLTLGATSLPQRTLAELCGALCAPIPPGTMVPKPAFTTTIPATIDVPADVVGATVTAATVTIALTQTFGFDPLQPSGRAVGDDGFIAVTVRNGARTLAVDTIRGAFPSGAAGTITRTLNLAPGEITGDLDVSLTLYSPAGGNAPQHWVAYVPGAQLLGTVTPEAVAISEARVTVQDRTVEVEAVSLDLSDIDQEMADRVVSGAFIVDVNNPLGVVGTMTLTISGGSAGVITKQLPVASGQSTTRVAFTQSELQSLLGRDLTLTVRGPVSAPTGTVTVTPGQQVTIATKLDLVFEVGGSEDQS